MDQRRSVGAELALGAIEAQHGVALAFGDRFAPLHAIDIFPGGIDRLRPALRPLPVVLERASAAILRVVDLMMRMQPSQRIAADRAQGDDLVAGLERHGIVDLDGNDFGVERQVARAAIVEFADTGRFSLDARHLVSCCDNGFEWARIRRP